jgi:cytochrome c oxidase subunit 4
MSLSDQEHEYDYDFDPKTGHHSHGKVYFVVFCALCVFTLLSIVADLVHIPSRIVLAVATCKSLCVMLFFMHLKFERAWKYLLLAPTLILACTIPFALAPDIGMTYYTRDVPQVYEYEAQQAAGKADHAPTAAKHD